MSCGYFAVYVFMKMVYKLQRKHEAFHLAVTERTTRQLDTTSEKVKNYIRTQVTYNFRYG
jgi:hypothetical protein